MEIQFLREFMVLSETCSYQNASERLYITNSTLSKHIQKMEAEFGFPLFERSTRKVALTDAGKILQQKCGQILPLYDEALVEMNKENAKATNTLSVAFASTMYRYGVLDTILAFKDAYPEINVQISELPSPPQKSTFIDESVEFAFADNISRIADDVNHQPVAKEELVLVVSDKSPFFTESSLELPMIAREPLILSDTAFLQDLFFDKCAEAGFSPDIRMCTGRSQNVFKLVAGNYASAVFPRTCLQEYNGTKELHAVSFSPPITFDIHMLYMKHRSFSSAGKLFFDYVMKQGEFL
ncbi:MAG: LysR family transcriptional regulator [Clostridiales bacterium]|nr:LysR family transcriptional regulator [Clostridiales bacterium]